MDQRAQTLDHGGQRGHVHSGKKDAQSDRDEHTAGLAQAIQKAAVAQLSLPDNGVKRENLAVVRGTWMPSVLVEGAFIIMPDQEAALRTPEYQERYAQGIVNGLEAYFRSIATSQR